MFRYYSCDWLNCKWIYMHIRDLSIFINLRRRNKFSIFNVHFKNSGRWHICIKRTLTPKYTHSIRNIIRFSDRALVYLFAFFPLMSWEISCRFQGRERGEQNKKNWQKQKPKRIVRKKVILVAAEKQRERIGGKHRKVYIKCVFAWVCICASAWRKAQESKLKLFWFFNDLSSQADW